MLFADLQCWFTVKPEKKKKEKKEIVVPILVTSFMEIQTFMHAYAKIKLETCLQRELSLGKAGIWYVL